MDIQSIKPIVKMADIKQEIEKNNVTQTGSTTSFADLYKGMIDNYKDTQAQVDADSVALATGTIDDLHTVTINAAKMEAALNLTTTVTSKVLSAYQSIMNMNI